MSAAQAWEATEASLPEWTRPDVIDWSTADEFARGARDAATDPNAPSTRWPS